MRQAKQRRNVGQEKNKTRKNGIGYKQKQIYEADVRIIYGMIRLL